MASITGELTAYEWVALEAGIAYDMERYGEDSSTQPPW